MALVVGTTLIASWLVALWATIEVMDSFATWTLRIVATIAFLVYCGSVYEYIKLFTEITQ